MALRIRIALGAALGVAALAFACGTDAIGIDACRQIETARCGQAPACAIDLTNPVHRSSPGTDVDACVRFYHEQCLHGLATTKEPGNVQVKDCVDAINAGDCEVVKRPEIAPACAWLIPPDVAAPDASDGAADVTGDAPADVTAQ
jgi:hypothetical protein